MPSLIIASASRSSPCIFNYHSSHIILIPSSFHSIISHFSLFHSSISPWGLRDFAKTHFRYFYLSYPPLPYSTLLSSQFHLLHPHHYPFLSSLPIRIYVLHPFISIYSHPILPLIHFIHTLFYPFPFHSSHPLPFHHYHSFLIPLLTLHSHTLSGTITLHYQPSILFSFIPSHFIYSRHFSFLFHRRHSIHLISSLLFLITSLYLLSFSINLDSILFVVYYDMSISFSHYSPITPLSFYSLSFLFISSFLIPLFVIAPYNSFPFIPFPSRPLNSLPSFYPISLIHSTSSSLPILSNTPPSLLHSLPILPLFIPPSSSTHRSSYPFHSFPSSSFYPILFSSHPSSISSSTPPYLLCHPLSSLLHFFILFSYLFTYSTLFLCIFILFFFLLLFHFFHSALTRSFTSHQFSFLSPIFYPLNHSLHYHHPPLSLSFLFTYSLSFLSLLL